MTQTETSAKTALPPESEFKFKRRRLLSAPMEDQQDDATTDVFFAFSAADRQHHR